MLINLRNPIIMLNIIVTRFQQVLYFDIVKEVEILHGINQSPFETTTSSRMALDLGRPATICDDLGRLGTTWPLAFLAYLGASGGDL